MSAKEAFALPEELEDFRLLVREIVRLRHTDPGMSVGNVLTVHVGQRMTPRTDARQWYEIAAR